jgi:hypothetical protein
VLVTTAEVVARIADGTLPKGEALGTARLAGIMGAKQTSTLIPLCHPLPLTKLAVDLEPQGDRVRIVANAVTNGVTGVEMEALTAATIAALTLRHDQGRRQSRHHHRREGAREVGRQERRVVDRVSRTAAVLVASTRAAAGVYADRTGPIIAEWLRERGFGEVDPVIVADADVGDALAALVAAAPDLVLTTGARASPRRPHPEATRRCWMPSSRASRRRCVAAVRPSRHPLCSAALSPGSRDARSS